MAAIQAKPWHASTGETEVAKIMNTIHWRAAATAAIRAAAAGLAQADVETLPLSSAAVAHERLENHSVNGRLVLHP
jgi:D-arabinose 1-dehydrogenase-like Zn-dependent alcohol dehydrogenase